MSNARLALILPSRGRPEQLLRCIDRIVEVTPSPFELTVVLDMDDEASRCSVPRYPGVQVVLVPPCRGPIYKWNVGLSRSPEADLYVLGADDQWYNPGWLAAALEDGIARGYGLVGLNDGHNADHDLYWSTLFLATRDFLIHHNGGVLAIPCYTSYFVDVETTDRAIRAGEYLYAERASVEHRHAAYGKALTDSTYAWSQPHFDLDKKTYERRKAAGFPDDFSPVLRGAPCST